MILNLTKPTLLVDQNKCKKNIVRIARKCKKHGLQFRPHFKTHQSRIIGEWFRDEGIRCITVSSVSMAEYFAGSDWKDITIAFPTNIAEIEKINELAGKIELNLLVESEATTAFLTKNLTSHINIFIKIDTGAHRTGLAPDNYDEIDRIISLTLQSPNLISFKGFLTHAGHTYKAKSSDEIQDKHNKSVSLMLDLKNKYSKPDFPVILSVGDTPTSTLCNNFEGIDEIRPGNFIFYDLMQKQLGVCSETDIAIALACPVVVKHQQRNEVIIYGGAVHFSKEFIEIKNRKVYGKLVKLTQNGWTQMDEDIYVTGLSQEHGIISAPKAFIEAFRVGDFLGILPVHSCLTANLASGFRIL